MCIFDRWIFDSLISRQSFWFIAHKFTGFSCAYIIKSKIQIRHTIVWQWGASNRLHRRNGQNVFGKATFISYFFVRRQSFLFCRLLNCFQNGLLAFFPSVAHSTSKCVQIIYILANYHSHEQRFREMADLMEKVIKKVQRSKRHSHISKRNKCLDNTNSNIHKHIEKPFILVW